MSNIERAAPAADRSAPSDASRAAAPFGPAAHGSDALARSLRAAARQMRGALDGLEAKEPAAQRVAVVLPCHNEAASIGRVVREFSAALPGARQVVAFDIESVQTACGFGVPLMTLEGQRSTMTDYWIAEGEDGVAEYQRRKNRVSIDGLPTGLGQ